MLEFIGYALFSHQMIGLCYLAVCFAGFSYCQIIKAGGI